MLQEVRELRQETSLVDSFILILVDDASLELPGGHHYYTLREILLV